MNKWFRFFCFSFFSHKASKEAVKRDYANVFLGFVLALVLLWAGFVSGDMLPFGSHYNSSPDFKASVYSVFTNSDDALRIDARIEDGVLRMKKQGGEYVEGLLINTFEIEMDKQSYSQNGYNVVVDSRPANTLAEIEAYYISNDGKNTVISYEDYLGLSEVARLNFEFKLRYTGQPLELDDESVKGYRAYLDSLSDENKAVTESLAIELAEGKITGDEYNRAVYELYFENYYPEISEYEGSSKVPLLRNYYYHQYISKGIKNYLFIFDDYMAGCFETRSGIEVNFYGFYGDLEDGDIVSDTSSQKKANSDVDEFVKKSYKATGVLNLYAYAMNIFTLVPFIALMLMVAALLTYSLSKLCGVENITTLGGVLKIVGSFAWFSGVISTVLTIIISFFVSRSLINALPLVFFFLALAIRSIIFAIYESKLYKKQLEQETKQTEV